MEEDGIVEEENARMDRVGDRLRAAREAKGLELEQVAAETRIPQRHLESIEAGDFASLPSRTYAIGFSRTYARTLDLDEREVLDQVRAYIKDSDDFKQQAMNGWIRVLSVKYGTDYAQAKGAAFVEELNKQLETK